MTATTTSSASARNTAEPVSVLATDELADLDAVVLTPAHQFPPVVLGPERRTALLAWAVGADAMIIVDDYDAEYRYDRQPIGALHGLDPGRVVYAGSVSKTLAPALRLGWLVAPARLAEAVAREKAADDLGTPVVEQLALADFLERGELDRHLRGTRLEYRRRRDALVGALRRYLPQARVAGVAAGLHLAVYLPEGTDEAAALAAARGRGIGTAGLSEHRTQPGPPALLLGYGRITQPSIDAGVRAVSAALTRRSPHQVANPASSEHHDPSSERRISPAGRRALMGAGIAELVADGRLDSARSRRPGPPGRSALHGQREDYRARMDCSALKLVEFPADDPERALRFWRGLLGVPLEPRTPEQGEGWQSSPDSGPAIGVHARGGGPGDTRSLPYFEVDDMPRALQSVSALGGAVIHPGGSWAVCKDSEGTPFGLAARTI
jgi:predicted enzyme related to lactoylglutathione lyase